MPKLRIGIMAAKRQEPEPWVVRLVDKIFAADTMKIVALIEPISQPARKKTNIVLKAWHALEKRTLSRPIPADPSNWNKISSLVPTISSGDPGVLKKMALDVILDVDALSTSPDLSEYAKYGVWFVDICAVPNPVAGLREASRTSAGSTITLCQYRNADMKPRALANAVVISKFIAAQNALLMKEKAITLILRELNRVHECAQCEPIEQGLEISDIPTPTIFDLLKYLFRLWRKVLAKIVNIVLARTGFRSRMFFLKTGAGSPLSLDPARATAIIPVGNTYWADPFLWERDGEVFCFFENYDYKTRHGHISVGRLDGEKFEFIGDVLKQDYHMSYPMLFEDGDELYMLPETNQAGRIEIWRCTDFPLRWTLHATALEGASTADSVILKNKGKWWLFSNIASDIYGDNSSELHIFEIDGPSLNKLTPHKHNPVVFDCRTARGGGRIHELDGKLYRPSQDYAYGRYGYGLNLMEIDTLGSSEYREKLVWRIGPDFEAGISGCHHFDVVGERFIVDVMKTIGGRGKSKGT